MTEYIEPMGDPEERADAYDMLDDPDLDLITEYVTGQLPPERVAEVARRLEQDEAFRRRAAPLVAVWSMAPRWTRKPMPRAELDRYWDEFTKRAGFVHQRAKTRRRRRWWIFGTLVTLATVWLTLPFFLPISDTRWSDMVPVSTAPDSAGWLHLGDGIRARLQPGAKLHRAISSDPAARPFTALRLQGSGRFVVDRTTLRAGETDPDQLIVHAEAAIVSTSTEVDFVLRSRPDTTDIQVFSVATSPEPRTADDLEVVAVSATGAPGIIDVVAGEHARVLAGSAPVWLIKKLRGAPVAPAPPPPPVTEEDEADLVPLDAVPDSAGWISINAVSRIRLDPGARVLRPRKVDPGRPLEAVWLKGTARIIREAPGPRHRGRLTVGTEAGSVDILESADIRVSARGDTTDVEVLSRQRPTPEPTAAPVRRRRVPDSVILHGGDPPVQHLRLKEGEIGRLRANVDPVKLRANHDVTRNPLTRWLFR